MTNLSVKNTSYLRQQVTHPRNKISAFRAYVEPILLYNCEME